MIAKPIRAAAIAGALAALVLVLIQMALQSSGVSGPPMGVAVASKLGGQIGVAALVVGSLAFALAGSVWGALYALLVSRISPISGALFGIAPTVFALAVMLPLLGKPAFAGGDFRAMLIPLALNMLWGFLVGALIPMLDRRAAKINV